MTRILVALRGVAGCGKSTFIANKGLQQYTISADDIRLLIESPILTIDGGIAISQKNDKRVWELIRTLTEDRMKRGEFTIIDATHSRASSINDYRKLAEKYRYRVYVCDFSNIPYEKIVEQNNARMSLRGELHKYVPQEAIDNMYARIKTQEAPGWTVTFKPEEWDNLFGPYQTKDFGRWKKIHHIGDLHGCHTVLKEYLDKYSDGVFKEDEFYIFLGDYVDRGIENYELVSFLMQYYDAPNIYFLEGNHEKWLRHYAHDEIDQIRSNEFLYGTMPELVGIDKKQLREWTRRFGQMAYYTYPTYCGTRTVFVNHGGVPILPTTYMASDELIHGTGKYEDIVTVQKSFSQICSIETYQIHGHRNIEQLKIDANPNCINLCDKVEFGGNLRVATLQYDGFNFFEIPNTVYKPIPATEVKNTNGELPTVKELVAKLRSSKGVNEKRFLPDGTYDKNGPISSFNFTRKVFLNNAWDDITELARSLYINTNNNTIVARAYPKWFKINEVEEAKLANLKTNLVYPLEVYIKENGFLGLVGYDEESNTVIYTTKGSLQGNYLQWFKDTFDEDQKKKIEWYVRNSGYTLIFECIDPVNDSHIIEEPQTRSILLDAIKRDIEFKKLSYRNLVKLSEGFGVRVKWRIGTIANYEQLVALYEETQKYDYQYANMWVEGFVLEDANGNCVKLKTEYYNFWKWMRGVKDTLRARKPLDMRKFYTARSNEVVAWLKKQTPETLTKSIVELRNIFEIERK